MADRRAPTPKADIGQPIAARRRRAKVTGEARYGSDMPVANPAYRLSGHQLDRQGHASTASISTAASAVPRRARHPDP